ncbi:MAG: hypothetical protein AAF411_06515 [Myxococcota bacterium]
MNNPPRVCQNCKKPTLFLRKVRNANEDYRCESCGWEQGYVPKVSSALGAVLLGFVPLAAFALGKVPEGNELVPALLPFVVWAFAGFQFWKRKQFTDNNPTA